MTALLELTIDAMGAQGDGIAHYNGDAMFVAGALPGEKVTVTLGPRNEHGLRAELQNVISASPERIAPPCRHFPRCGGCRFQHMALAVYSGWKMAQLQQLLAREGLAAVTLLPPVITAPKTRRRARLAAAHGKDGIQLGFNAWRSHELVTITGCEVLLPVLTDFIQALREKLVLWLPRDQACDVQLTALAGGIDMVLVGGPALGLDERQNLGQLAQELNVAQLSWRKWDRSPVEQIAYREPLAVTFGTTNVPFPAGSFLQATAAGEKALIDFTSRAAQDCGKVMDLFSGLGGFGLSLPGAKQVTFADMDGPALAMLAQAVKAKPHYRVMQRNLSNEPFSASECNPFDAVIFDPPRGGARTQAAQLAKSKVSQVIAISCDPASFVRDAKLLLAGGYKLAAVQPVDQFLWSSHMELAAHFTR